VCRGSLLGAILSLMLMPGLASPQDSAAKSVNIGEQDGVAKTPSSPVELMNLSRSTAVFIENQGQFDPQVKFQVTIGRQTAWLTARGVVFEAVRATESAEERTPQIHALSWLDKSRDATLPVATGHLDGASQRIDRLVFAEDLVNAKCCSKLEGRMPRTEIYNYFLGPTPSHWHSSVRGFAEVIYHDVWPDIDLRLYGSGSNLEQEFLVKAGGNLALVQVSYRGIKSLNINGDGSLAINTEFGTLRETKPKLFQSVAGRSSPIEGLYKLTSQVSYTFEVPSHNPLYPLVIDPTLLFSTYMGGAGLPGTPFENGVG